MLVDRDHIGLFGKMNSGKSSLMNLLTQQETSITDSTPGTTSDTKIAMQEIHGMGPVKLYDTAGMDEESNLGEKKKSKVLNVLKECDLVLLVIDPSSIVSKTEVLVVELARELDKQLLVIFNLFQVNDQEKIKTVYSSLPLLKFYPSLAINVIDAEKRQELLHFILENFDSRNHKMELFPFVEKDEFYVLNIPMDEETPQGRFLRPQAMAEEYITRSWAYPVSYRMNLGVARSENPKPEKDRFDAFLNSFSRRPKAIITDSQAMDIMAKWTPDDIMLTTFSIMMINYVSKGRIIEFYEGIKAMDTLKKGDKVLIAEACNHSRIKEDIGTVQIPNKIKESYPGVGVELNFGREFQENKELSKYKLIIHCGGCMISNQKMQSRLRDLRSVDVPITNYGIFLSWMQGGKALERVMEPWR
ncbi:MAG: 50S ribosome-binding GTPase [Prolixibacteraceae bacterium]|jgi:[FeFe] hydrogenase H-cluster maturation GTPase HydF|nr:50S ribosome-binding GTPase [Prolixibacteraceae bacterium]